MIKDNVEDAYLVVFSRKLYKYLLKKNIVPFIIEPNKKYPNFRVYKYKYSEYTESIINDYRAGKIII